MEERHELNKIIHEPARLMILTFLASSPERDRSFTELRDHLQMTAGNLSVQLKKLQDAGFISIRKGFDGGKPLTTAVISPYGVDALMDYLDEMEKLILSVKKAEKTAGKKS
ncbi:MAG: winged helix-turn-helix domain-containing protein [Bacillota bacterium]